MQWLSAYLVTRSLSNEVWDKVNFRFNTTPPNLIGTGSIRKWNFKIMHQTIPCGRDSTLFRVLLVWVHTNFLKITLITLFMLLCHPYIYKNRWLCHHGQLFFCSHLWSLAQMLFARFYFKNYKLSSKSSKGYLEK